MSSSADVHGKGVAGAGRSSFPSAVANDIHQ
jgi:hypothetical protein